MQMDSVKTPYLKELIQLGDFLSVFLLTRSGLSYLTSEIFGGIILFVFRSEYLQLMEEKTKTCGTSSVALEMLHGGWSTTKTSKPLVPTPYMSRV